MALFGKDETQPLSSFQAEPISEAVKPVELTPVGDGTSPTSSLVGSAIDVDSRLKVLERKIVSSKRKLVLNVLAIGESLAEAQDLLADHHGGAFTRWIKQRCGFTPKTAYKYLAAWRTFGSCEPGSQRRFDVSAMHLLAHDSTPEPAVSEALELASNGKKVTTRTAREIIARHSPKTVRSKPGRPQPILLTDAQAIITIRPLSEGVDICSLLGRVLKEQLDKRRAAA